MSCYQSWDGDEPGYDRVIKTRLAKWDSCSSTVHHQLQRAISSATDSNISLLTECVMGQLGLQGDLIKSNKGPYIKYVIHLRGGDAKLYSVSFSELWRCVNFYTHIYSKYVYTNFLISIQIYKNTLWRKIDYTSLGI